MNREEEIVAFLKKNRAHDYCDKCLSEQLLSRRVSRSHVRTVTATLALMREFNRGKRRCKVCGRTDVLVVRFL
jgi:hypothetical protein